MKANSPRDEEPVDLFGAPISQIRERWGRPTFAKTKENQELVAALVADGLSHERIAAVLGCHVDTLRKHFSPELERGADVLRAMAIMVVVAGMRQGKSVYTRMLLDRMDKRSAQSAPRRNAKPPRLGKKEQALRDAHRAGSGSDWGDDLVSTSL